MASSTFKDLLYWQLFRVAISTKHNLMNVAEQHGLTVMQMYTLCLLEADTSIPMNSLSSMLHCDASNITGIVDRLLIQDYIRREENPKDRREKMITVTAKGAALCQTLAALLEKNQPESLKNLSSKEQEQLRKILTKVLETK